MNNLFIRSGLTIMSLCFSISLINSQTNQFSLNFISGKAQLQEDADGRLTMNDISNWDSFSGSKYGLVSLERYPKRDERLKLEQEGIFILEFIPTKAYLIRIAASANLQSLNQFGLIGSSAFLPEFKIAFHQSETPEHAITSDSQVLINVHPYAGIHLNKVRSLLNSQGFHPTEEEFANNVVIIRCLKSDFQTLCGLPFVHYIDWRYDPGEPENYTGRTLHRVNFISPENTNGIGYDGSGIDVMLQDDGEIGPHIDFHGRLDQTWPTSSGDHGDHCAGIICGAGNLSPFNEGQAKGSDLHVYKASPQYTGFDSIPVAYYSKGIVITSTSYSNGCNAGYTSFTQEMDEQVNNMESLMHVFSAGNSGTSDCGYGAGNFWGNITGGHKMGKNVITVANLDKYDALANSSSRGPAHDGRIKPDISAKGTSVLSTGEENTYNTKTGTSMSCPGVSGTLAVLYEAYKDVHGSLPESGLIKAIVLNTADDLGNTGPDFKHGWGRINARKAFEVIEDTAFTSGNLGDGDSVVVALQIPSNVAKARFMVYWTDPEASVSASTALVNDLDMIVAPPSSSQLLPYLLDHTANASTLNNPATNGADHLNNMEQVEVFSPISGSYSIVIKGHNVPFGPQKFFLVYWFEKEELTLIYPAGGEHLIPFTEEIIRWDSPYQSGNLSLEYSSNGGASWTTVSSSIPVLQGYYNWTPPSTASGNYRIRLTYGSEIVTSDNFNVIGRPSNLNFEFSCPDSIGLTWNSVSQATGYIVYRLGQKYMEAIGTTSTNSFVDYTANPFSTELWYSVAATGPNNAVGKRMDAEQKPSGVFDCIINTDAAIARLSPVQGSYRDCFGDSLALTFTIRNMAILPIGSATIHINTSSGQVLSETLTFNLPPGDSIDVTLSQPLALGASFDTLSAYIDVALDGNPFNDSIVRIYRFPESALTTPKLTEDFESFTNCSMDPLCETIECSIGNGWFNEKNGEADDIDWRVNSGVTPTEFTGPVTDHTTGSSSGKYIYMESSDCYFKTAMLTSPCIDLTDAITPSLTFWYHMQGNAVGSLTIDVLDSNGWTLSVFSLSGEQGSDWKFTSVDLSAFIGKIVVVRFRGTTGNGFQSDIAIDDIGITHPPVSKFSYYVQQDGLTVDFIDQSIYADTMIFETGDGFTFGSLPISHSYAQAQGYLVKQTVFNPFGTDASIQAISTLGLEAKNSDMTVFPNPASDKLHLKMNFLIQSIEIFSSTGELVRKMNNKSASNQLDLNVLDFESGYYLIRVNGSSLIPLSVIH